MVSPALRPTRMRLPARFSKVSFTATDPFTATERLPAPFSTRRAIRRPVPLVQDLLHHLGRRHRGFGSGRELFRLQSVIASGPAGRNSSSCALPGAESEDASRDRTPCSLSGARLRRVRGAASVGVRRGSPGLGGSELAGAAGLRPQPSKSPGRRLRSVRPLLGGRILRSPCSRAYRPTRRPATRLGRARIGSDG